MLDTMALGWLRCPLLYLPRYVLDIEDNIAQNLDDSVEFMRIGADVLEELGDFAQESTDAIGGIYNATKNALNEMDLSDKERFVTFWKRAICLNLIGMQMVPIHWEQILVLLPNKCSMNLSNSSNFRYH